MWKRLVCVFMGIIILISVMPTVFAEKISMTEFTNRINSIQSKYREGTSVSQIYNSTYNGSACYKDLSGWSSWQCMAWASYVFDTVWKVSVRSDRSDVHSDVNRLFVGDYVRYRSSDAYDHSIFITKISGNDIYYTDGNGQGTNLIRYNVHTTKSALQALLNKKLKDEAGNGYIRHSWDNGLNSDPNPANLGNDFYAVILHKNSWKPISHDDDGYVRLRTETGTANQVWRFIRQSDGAYVIASTKNNKLLELTAGDTTNGKPVSVGGEDWGGNYQRWYLFEYGGGYIIQSKHYTNLNRVLDLDNGNTNDGTSILTYQRNNTAAQIWAIYCGNEIKMKSPYLEEKKENTITTLSWNNIYGESAFDLYISKDGGEYKFIRKLAGESCLYAEVLPDGNYTAYVSAINAFYGVNSNTVSFSILDGAVAPSSWIKSDKITYCIGESVNLHFGYKYTTSVSLGINKDGVRYETPDVTGKYSYSFVPTEPGKYSVYVSGWSQSGYEDSKEISFTVNDSSLPISMKNEISIRDNSLFVDSTISNLHKSAVLIVKSMDYLGNALDVSMKAVPAGATSASVEIPSSVFNKRIKVFLWDSQFGMKPLCESEELNL